MNTIPNSKAQDLEDDQNAETVLLLLKDDPALLENLEISALRKIAEFAELEARLYIMTLIPSMAELVLAYGTLARFSSAQETTVTPKQLTEVMAAIKATWQEEWKINLENCK